MQALIIVDVQNDFLPGGALAVPMGDEIIPMINQIQQQYSLVVACQDWHPHNHKSFVTQQPDKALFDIIELNGMPQVLWPEHCIQGQFGAQLSDKLEQDRIEAIFRKGVDPLIDSYSAFFDNHQRKTTGLAGYLRERNVTVLDVCGLAADYCVYYTAKDALTLGFKARIIENAIKAIDLSQFELIKKEFIQLGGEIIKL